MPTTNNSTPAIFTQTATVLETETESDIIDTVGLTLVGITTPSGITSATFSFLVSDAKSGAFLPYVSAPSLSLVEINLLVDKYVGLAAIDFVPLRFFKIKTNLAEGADRIFKIHLRRIA